MLIALQLVATPQGPVVDEPVRSFEDDQIVIGRAPNCHVVLPDGLRIISRQHARLTIQRGEVLITCLSASAPVRVNHASVPHGGTLPLHGGDVIHIGGFDLCLSLPARATATPMARPVAPPVAVAAAAVPLAAPVPAAVPVAAPPAPLKVVPAAAPEVEPAPARRGRARLDEWFDLDPAPGPQGVPGPAPAAPPLTAPGEVDLDLRSGAYAPRGAELRVFESLQEVLSPPAPKAPAGTAPAGGGAADVSRADIPPADIPPADIPPVDISPADAAPADAAPAAFPQPPEAVAANPRPAPIAPDDAAAEVGLVLLDVAGPAEPAPAEPPSWDEPAHAELMQAFLEGAGLAPRMGATNTQLLAPMALTPAWMRHIGALLRASVEGSLALLHSRSTVKREMRAEVTVIARRQNNPLKFAPDALAALAHLVAPKRTPGFLEPVAALKDAHEDLLVHHLAVVAGMRAAMFELIARLGPDDVVRDEGPPKGLAMTLPTLQEAALWRRYRQRHAEMTARLDDDFETVFGREFTKAYEAQARRVRERAPPEDTTS